jgi:hypothetical protein
MRAMRLTASGRRTTTAATANVIRFSRGDDRELALTPSSADSASTAITGGDAT